MQRLYRDAAGPGLAPRGSAVCIGAFDGVHRGHRIVLERVCERAKQSELDAIAVSFDPIPRVFFSRETNVPQLTSVRQDWNLAGTMLADMMFGILEGRTVASRKLPVELIVRASTQV